MTSDNSQISEGLLNSDLWDRLDLHLGSYVKSPIHLRYLSTKTFIIGQALRTAIIDLLDHTKKTLVECKEDNVTTLGEENRLYHSRQYKLCLKDDNATSSKPDDEDEASNVEICSLAPTMFYQLREDINISNAQFRHSFGENYLKDFTNPGKSGSLMYKTHDELFLLKTLREYEARLLIQVLHGYCLQFRQRPTMFNRYIGLYSMRFEGSLSDFTIYVVIMVNAFTPSLKINEIYDLKGSTIKRRVTGYLSAEKFYKLKDMNFKDLYPEGIRIPTHIYHKLKRTLANDSKTLKKLNITDFSLVVGIRHIDMTKTQLLERQQLTGITALLHAASHITLAHMENHFAATAPVVDSVDNKDELLPNSYLKPVQMLRENIDRDLYYNNDTVAYATYPIPGIVNHTNKRVYIYLALVDMLQTFDNFKHIDQTIRKLTDRNRHLEYSVIEPDNYEQRFNQFLFKDVFVDAQDNFSWDMADVSQPVADIDDKANKKKKRKKIKNWINAHSNPTDDSESKEPTEHYF